MNKIIIAIDNDECIGSWGDLSMLYSIIKNVLNKNIDDYINMFINIIDDAKCIRPYLRNVYDKLIELKEKNIICGIYMCTAASNISGWVIYLANLLEIWYGRKIYDKIIDGIIIQNWHIVNGTPCCNQFGYIKDMHMIKNISGLNDVNIIIIDDKPYNIINGISIGVTPFEVALNLSEIIKIYFPDDYDFINEKYDYSISANWTNYIFNPHIYTNVDSDKDLETSIELLEQLIQLN